MTDQQEAAIRAVLAAAPEGALRRVLRQPVRLWGFGCFVDTQNRTCLFGVLEEWVFLPDFGSARKGDFLQHREREHALKSFDNACATDGLPATVRRVKALTREEIQRRG
jgi:hypothetical protein